MGRTEWDEFLRPSWESSFPLCETPRPLTCNIPPHSAGPQYRGLKRKTNSSC